MFQKPMSSAMMTRMFGFCGCCAKVGDATLAEHSAVSSTRKIPLVALILDLLRIRAAGALLHPSHCRRAISCAMQFRPKCRHARPVRIPGDRIPVDESHGVNAEATVGSSSITTLAGGLLPSTVNRTTAGLLPLRAVPFGRRAPAIFDRTRPKKRG